MSESSDTDVVEEKAHYQWLMLRTEVGEQAAWLAGIAQILQWLTILGAVVVVVFGIAASSSDNGGGSGVAVVLTVVPAVVLWTLLATMRLFAKYVIFRIDPRS